MLTDLVIDTNVLMHAQNPSEERFASSRQLLEDLLQAETHLCVDEGFSHEEAKNRSMIGSEYLSHLRAGSLGLQVVATLASRGRVRQLERAPYDVARKANQLIRKKSDRVFVGVAFNSEEKVLVSHDFEDFQALKRVAIQKSVGVRIIEAVGCVCR